MTIRVAFTLIDKYQWAGGYQYQINLLRIWSEYGDPRILPVLFVGQDDGEADIKPFRSLIDDRIVASPVFNQKRKGRRLIDAFLSGKDRGAEKIFKQNQIDVIFDSAVYYGRSFGIPAIAWIPDFQHIHMPEMFSEEEIIMRNLHYKNIADNSNIVILSSYESKKDFEHKIGICKKEAKESRHWLRMVSTVSPELRSEAQELWREANELQLIFITIVRNSRNKED